MKNNNTNTNHTRLTDIVTDYKRNRTLLHRLFQMQLNGSITYDELKLQFVVYKRVRRLERILQSQIKTVSRAA